MDKKTIAGIELIPDDPGCYFFKSEEGIIIYIGKAKSLKKRVNSYFTGQADSLKTKVLVENIREVDFIATNSETEALILENNLIKKHQPRFNIDLKDSKGYAYLMITKEDFPRLVVARGRKEKGEFYGPFVSAAARHFVLDFIKRNFRLRTCRKLKKKMCLRGHIDLCDAPCEGKIDKDRYKSDVIENIRLLLKGKTAELSEDIRKKMAVFSAELRFEEALKCRKMLEALDYLKKRQLMERDRKSNEDVLNYRISGGKVYLMLFSVNNGVLSEKKDFVFEESPDFFEEFLLQYYSETPLPDKLVLPEDIDSSLYEVLCGFKAKKFELIIPKIGERKKLMELVDRNIDLHFFKNISMVEELEKTLQLPSLPSVIECFDISHLGGEFTVASMVQFRNGVPSKSNYRKFKIKTVSGIDDFKSIGEVVRRRYRRLRDEGSDFPDLVVIDGGPGQLNYALKELESLGVDLPVISLAKKFEEIYIPYQTEPVCLDKKNPALKLLQMLRDEAHRFAITFNRELRIRSLKDGK